MSRLNNNWVADLENNLCCTVQCAQDGEVVGWRKNIIIKSAGKNQKKQKTSLKKRSGTSNADKQPKQEQNEQSKNKNTQPKPIFIETRRVTPPRIAQSPILHINRPPIQNPIHNLNTFRYTPEKPHTASNFKQNKINFIYSGKETPMKSENIEFTLQQQAAKNYWSSENTNISTNPAVKQEPRIQKVANATNTTIYYSQTQSPMKTDRKSSQVGHMYTEKVETSDESPGLSRQFKIENSFPLKLSNKIQSSQPLSSLSSRKKTVLSVNGDSESQRSIAIFDLQPLPIIKSPGIIQTTKLIGQNSKISYPLMKSSINW